MPVIVAAAKKRVDDGREDVWFGWTEMIRRDQIDGATYLDIGIVVTLRVVGAAARRHLLCAQAKEKEIRLARRSGHLDGRAVACADRERAIHHELHVARAARFVSRR